MSIRPDDPRIEQEYYSDRLREQGLRVCEWHPGYAELDCPECFAYYESYMEDLMDAMREER